LLTGPFVISCKAWLIKKLLFGTFAASIYVPKWVGQSNRSEAGGRSMNFIIALIVGGVIGWLASKVMNTDAQQGIFLNIIVGCVGSLIGKFIAGNFLGMGGMGLRDGVDIPSLAVAFVGALILLGIVNLVRRGSVR
jgi:uncharacterized membrane protein YeaQ/YmgE (transglycosylase-associated protein family)